ncbi:MAG: hypothetical protein QHI48_00485 [Bacteroidota bacterium]|nr:hypothetical protein [Bacteroidota bacterium]
MIIGSVRAFTYPAFVYVKSRRVWDASPAHIAMNNSAQSFSYFTVLDDHLLANLGLVSTMIIMVSLLYIYGGFKIFTKYFASDGTGNVPLIETKNGMPMTSLPTR